MDCKEANFILPSGCSMPAIGFGTYLINGKQLIKEVLDFALNAGYRQIDTAIAYENESDIGKALKKLLPKYNLTRKDIFITSKLPPHFQGDQALDGLKQSIKNLDCEYLDLYLIHWPGAEGLSSNDPENQRLRAISWANLAEGVRQKMVRDIGVSNYTIRHLKELLNHHKGVRPAVNQVEWHPYYFQPDLKEFCENEGIVLEAYFSLGGTSNSQLLLNDSVVQSIAKKLNRTPAQVLLRWAFQQNIAIIPKGSTEEHIQENIDLNFEIPQEEMNKLYKLNRNGRLGGNPAKVL